MTVRLTMGGTRIAVDTREWEVYEALRYGNLTQVDLAEDWRVSRAAVSKVVVRLIRESILAEVPGCGTPKRYQRGPRGESYELMHNRQPTHRAGRLTASTPTIGVEVHRGGAKVEWIDGPRRPIPWTREWTLSGVRFHQMHHAFENERYFFKLSEGKTRSSLEVYPPRKWLWTVENLEQVATERKRRTVLAIRAFQREFGVHLRGEILQHQQDEYATEMPGAQPMGDPRSDDAWVDESKGRPEFETKKVAIMKRIATVDVWSRDLEQRMAAVEAHVADEKDKWERLVKLLEEEAAVRGLAMTATVQEVINRQNGGSHA